ALARLAADVIAQRPHLVTVMYGTNDSWIDQGQAASRLGEKAYEANLRALVRRLREARVQPVLMTAPRFAEQNPRNGLGEDPNVRLARYAGICRAVARDLQVPLVDHFSGWTGEQERGRSLQAWTTDGCHPNAEGHADLAARLVPVLAPLARGLLATP
ncbi:MAG: lysophospholipase, partial [Verrucomicrobia bacterium]|nr:lysophospholipase [Verrucomicrobiota bacterium]